MRPVDCYLHYTVWQESGFRERNCCFNGSCIPTAAMRQSSLQETNEVYAVSKPQVKQRRTVQLLHCPSFSCEMRVPLGCVSARVWPDAPSCLKRHNGSSFGHDNHPDRDLRSKSFWLRPPYGIIKNPREPKFSETGRPSSAEVWVGSQSLGYASLLWTELCFRKAAIHFFIFFPKFKIYSTAEQ
jgi:hypothetical protein